MKHKLAAMPAVIVAGVMVALTYSQPRSLRTLRRERTEQGGSASIEVLLIIALAIAVVAIVALGIKSYVRSHLPQ